MPALRQIEPLHVRRLAICKQHLDAQARPPMLDLIRDLGCLQLDPISKLARTHQIVLWSRLGNYQEMELERLRWQDRALFEYWAHCASLVLTEDYPIHEVLMRAEQENPRTNEFIHNHQLHSLRDHILQRIRDEGPLSPADIEHDQFTGETFNGWRNGRAVNRLMEQMWFMGELMVAARKGNQRRWQITELFLPDWTPREKLSPEEASRRSLIRSIRALGVAKGKAQINYHFTRGRYWHYAQAVKSLISAGQIEQVSVTGMPGDWYIHTDDLALLERIERGDWHPRTTLLSPFDNLICDRGRTETLWNFRYRIEIYTPQHKREFGYYVLPILHGDRLIGRMDMEFLKKEKCLHVISTYAEADAPPDAIHAIDGAVADLSTFLGAREIRYGKTVPAVWAGLSKLAL